MDVRESVPRRRWRVVAAAAAVIVHPRRSVASAPEVRDGGIFRVAFTRLDYVDPALAYSPESRALLDTTCARLMTYPDKPPPAGFRLVPEVAAAYPRASHDRKTWTFTLRTGFRFSNGAPVRAGAFARAINRTLSPEITSPALPYTQTVVGADDVGRKGRSGARRRRARQPRSSCASRNPYRTSPRGRRCRSSAPFRRVSTSTRKASTSSPPPGRTTSPSIGPANAS